MTRRASTLAEVAWLAGEVKLMQADQQSGRVPPDVTRPLYTHETHTDFAAIEQDVDQVAGSIARQMDEDRQAFIALLNADLRTVAANPGPDPVDVAVASRLLQLHSYLGVAAVAGAEQLVTAAEQRYRALLEQAAEAGGNRVADEAEEMGASTAGVEWKLPVLDQYRLDLAARRLALSPHTDVLDAAAALAYQLPGEPGGQLLPSVVDQLRGLSSQPLLTTLARPAVQQADSLGRQAAMVVLPAARSYYASELNDKATCGPCRDIDGTEYPSLEAAKADYPAGGYKGCLGGDRCRGMVIAVWGTEQQPFTQ